MTATSDNWYFVAAAAREQAGIVERRRSGDGDTPVLQLLGMRGNPHPAAYAEWLVRRVPDEPTYVPDPFALIEAAGRLLEREDRPDHRGLIEHLGAGLSRHQPGAGAVFLDSIADSPLTAYADALERRADLDPRQVALQFSLVAGDVTAHRRTHTGPIAEDLASGLDPELRANHVCGTRDLAAARRVVVGDDASLPDLVGAIGLTLAHRAGAALPPEDATSMDRMVDRLTRRLAERNDVVAGVFTDCLVTTTWSTTYAAEPLVRTGKALVPATAERSVAAGTQRRLRSPGQPAPARLSA